MKPSAKLLLAACLATLVAGPGSSSATAAEGEAPAQDLVQVSATDLVIAASWTKRPDAYVLQFSLDRSVPRPTREGATANPVATANPIPTANSITTISREDMDRLGIVNVADALLMLVPQNFGPPMPNVPNAGAPPNMERSDRGRFFIGDTIANLRGLDPWFPCGRSLTLVDGRRTVQGGQPAPAPTISYLNQPYPPEHKESRVEVWLLKADGTQILPTTYSCEAGQTYQPRTEPQRPIEISYQFPIAGSAQAVAAAIRVDDNFYIEKLQPAPQPAAQ